VENSMIDAIPFFHYSTRQSVRRPDGEHQRSHIMRQFFFRHLHGSEVLESDLIVCSMAEWQNSDESKQRSWSASFVGKRVYALRLPELPVNFNIRLDCHDPMKDD
jgi:hypothetical protein